MTSRFRIEDMHARLEEVTLREKVLIRALDEALAAADRNLLDDVRSVAIEHEARRAVILTELQALAARIGAFPVAERSVEHVSYEPIGAGQDFPRGGDWRTAAERISSEDGYDLDGASLPGEALTAATERRQI